MAGLEFHKILCPVDLSEASQGALAAAAALASQGDAALTLLHVDVVPGSAIPEAALETPAAVANDLTAPSDWPLLEWKARAEQLGVARVRVLRSIGTPAEEILALARREGFDLIVIGTHGRRGLGRIVLGSVAEEVARRAHCPVLTVGAEAAAALAAG